MQVNWIELPPVKRIPKMLLCCGTWPQGTDSKFNISHFLDVKAKGVREQGWSSVQINQTNW